MNEREKCAEILARHETSDAANMRSSYRDRIIDALLEARALASREALELALLAICTTGRNIAIRQDTALVANATALGSSLEEEEEGT